MNVRLTQKEIAEIVSVLSQFFDDESVSLYLYGSRTKMDLKGGDIDLLLVFNDEDVKTSCHLKKHIILAAIKERIGDQKIDLFFATQTQVAKDEFLQVIFPGAVLLHQWGF